MNRLPKIFCYRLNQNLTNEFRSNLNFNYNFKNEIIQVINTLTMNSSHVINNVNVESGTGTSDGMLPENIELDRSFLPPMKSRIARNFLLLGFLDF